MTYVILGFLFLSAASFALSLGYFFAAQYAKTGADFIDRTACAIGHLGWAFGYAAICAIILIVDAVLSL